MKQREESIIVKSLDIPESLAHKVKLRGFYVIHQNCGICSDQLLSEDIVRMSCGDCFHKLCILQWLQQQIKSNIESLRCPAVGCKQIIKQTLLSRLGIKEQDLRQYFRFQLDSLQQKNNLQRCFTPDCPYIFRFDPRSDVNIDCPICHKSYCIKCKFQSHYLYTCQEYQDTLDPNNQQVAFQKMMDKQNNKQCPKCKVWIQKSYGCNHMTCTCKFEFCYKCGRPYRHKDCTCPLFDRE